MDIGVGCYIGINAVNSAYRNIRNAHSASLMKASNIWIRVAPLFVLGLLRMISIKILGYPEHVSEYGVHWNFFISLAAIAIITDLFQNYTTMSSGNFIGKINLSFLLF